MNELSPAEKLLKRLGIQEPSEIDLEAIALTQNVKIKIRTLDGCEARIIGYNNSAIISVDGRTNPQRTRFSIAHELGHWKNDRGKAFSCKTEDIKYNIESNAFVERMANRYAADLILPNYLLLPLLRKIQYINWNEIIEIAKIFNTSLTATAIRIVESNDFPIILIAYENGRRKWFLKARQIPQRWFPMDTSEKGSIAHSFHKGTNNQKQDYTRAPADTWFEIDNDKDFEITEYTIRGYNSQFLTLLYFNDYRMLQDY